MKKITFLLLTLCVTTFFGQDKLTSSLSESFDGSTWVLMNRAEFIYDDGNNLTEEVDFSWNSGSSQWIKTGLGILTYNADNQVVVELDQSFNGAEIEEQNRATNTYNSEGKITQFLEEEYINSNWVNKNKVEVEYDNGIIVSAIRSEWDVVNGTYGEDLSRLALIYNDNTTLRSMLTESWEDSSWVTAARSVYYYNENNKRILEEDQFWDGSAWTVARKTTYVYDANGNVLTKKQFNNIDGEFVLEDEETNTFDLSQLMADLAHPYKDKTGVDYLFEINGIVNKILTTTSFAYGRTTYNYGESTASIPAFNLANVQVHPNPATDILNISIQNGLIFKIDVYNLLGKKIFTSTKTKINIESLAKGVYLLKIRSEDGGVITKKLIKN